jgi:acyl-coenzyme A synthetase/AMP-(fatty) acid ligase
MCAAPLAYRQLVLQDAQEYLMKNPPMALEHCTAAGEALNAEVSRKWHASTGIAIHEGYGQTETVLLCGHFVGVQVRPGSMGKPAPGVPLYIITATGEEAANDVEGDIAVHLAHGGNKATKFFGLFDGYATGEDTFTRREKVTRIEGQSRSWYLTGDRATRDSDGYFWFVGRADDVINSSGYRIGASDAMVSCMQLMINRPFRGRINTAAASCGGRICCHLVP